MRLFLGYAVIELVALVAAVNWLGFGPTLMLLLGGLLAGMWLVRREGSRTALAVAEAVRAGRMAHDELTDGALIGLGGLLIMVPGLVSDVLGLLLVLAPTRRVARRWLSRRAAARVVTRSGAVFRGPVVGGYGYGGPVRGAGPAYGGGSVPGGAGSGGRPVPDAEVVRGPVPDGLVVDGEVVESSTWPPGGTTHRPATG